MMIFFFAVRLDLVPTGGAVGWRALVLPRSRWPTCSSTPPTASTIRAGGIRLMAQDAAATLALPVLERRRRRNWRRYAGLSVPAAIAVVFVVCGAFAGLLSPDDPNFLVLAERL